MYTCIGNYLILHFLFYNLFHYKIAAPFMFIYTILLFNNITMFIWLWALRNGIMVLSYIPVSRCHISLIFLKLAK